MMPNMMDCGMGGLGALWMLLPLVFWIGLLALVVFVVVRLFPGVRRSGEGTGDVGAPGDDAEKILRGRFARGEINAEEYERSLEVLRRSGTSRRTYEDIAREARERGS